MFAIVKYVTEHGVHVVETLFYRYLVGAFAIAGWIVYRNGRSIVQTQRPFGHALRAILGMGAMGLNFWSITLLPLSEATLLLFVAPLVSTVLSVLILSEVIKLRRWIAVVVGFLGVAIALQPGTEGFNLFGVAVALVGAVFTGTVTITIRSLSKTESNSTILFFYYAIALPILGVAMLFYGQVHSLEIMGMLALLGIFGTIGMVAMTDSLRYAPIAVLMPVDYFNLVFAAGFGYLFWDTIPAMSIWLGFPLIVGSGVFIAWREARLKSKAPS